MKIRLFAVLFVIALALSAFCIAAGAEGSEPTVRTHAYNLVLDNNVYIRYAIKVENPADVTIDEVGMQVWRKDDASKKTTDLKATLQDVQGVACYVVDYTGLTAKEMTDVVVSHAYIKYGGNTYYEETEREYSIVEYAKYQLGYIEGQPATEKQELIALIKDMLYYGASAQKFANYKTDNLATDFLNEKCVRVTYNTKLVTTGFTNPNPSTFQLCSGMVKLQPLVAKGYTFQYWIDETTQEPVISIDTSKASDITLTAIVTADRYSITYKNTMGVWNDNPDYYTVLDSINLRPLEKYDYTFNGWRLHSPYGDFVGEDGIPEGTTGNVVLYADWTLKPEFENMLYVVDDEYNLPNGQKFCMLTGVIDDTVTTVEISSVFNHIKEGALENCHWLTELTLPYLGSDYTTSNYLNVGYLFGYASNAEAEGAIPTSLRKLTVKGGVIGDYAFANLKTVKEIVLSPEVTKIGYNAFSNCEGLEDLTMPLLYVNDRTRRAADANGYVTSHAKYYGFPGCVSSEDNSYDGKTFRLHINGGGIHHSAANDRVWEHDGAIIGSGFGGSLFELCKGISEVTIDNITVIPQFAFARCSNLKKVTIGNAVQNIMAGAFFATGIEEIVIPDSVKEIGEYWYAEYSDGYSDRCFGSNTYDSGNVFGSCKSLRKVVIGNGVENIPAYMFRGCTNLEEITIGENVRFVDEGAFFNTNDTFKVINNSTHKEWVVSGPVSERFMNQLMASENAPEKIYYGYEKFVDKRVDGFTESQIKDWNIVFYSPTDPYADGSATDIEYWYHEDGADWYKNQYTVTPKLWSKPQASEGENN